MNRQDLIHELEARLARWDAQLDSVQTELARNPDRRDAHRDEIDALQAERRRAAERLAQLRRGEAGISEAETGEDDIGHGLLRIFDNIGRRLERLVSHTR